jgi:hypothetical protein
MNFVVGLYSGVTLGMTVVSGERSHPVLPSVLVEQWVSGVDEVP